MAHPGHGGRRGAARAGGVVVLLLACTGLAGGCSGPIAAAPTSVRVASGATVVHADGRVEPARAGMRLSGGDVVRTASGAGRAELVTARRVVYVGPDAIVAVADGGHQQLEHGAVVVDARRGSGLWVGVAGFTVHVARGAVRVERSYALRVGALSGAADVTSAAGRAVRVGALHQVVAVGDALPERSDPLRLVDDAAERRVAPALVGDDERLTSLAGGIDATPPDRVVATVTAAYRHPLPSFPAAVPASERVLPVAIAAAARTDPAGVFADRADGGSWAVVARLHGTDAAAVLVALDTLEQAVPLSALGRVTLAAALATAGGSASVGPAPATFGPPTGASAPRGTGPRPATSPSPSPSPNPVTTVVDIVEGILPSPTSTRSPTVAPAPVQGLPQPRTSPAAG